MEVNEVQEERTVKKMNGIFRNLEDRYRSMIALKEKIESEVREKLEAERLEEARKNIDILIEFLTDAGRYMGKIEKVLKEVEAENKVDDKNTVLFNSALSEFNRCEREHKVMVRRIDREYLK